MELRKQILLLAALPLFGLVLTGAYLCVWKLQEFRHAAETQQQIADVNALTALVHVLQVERGQSAGFVASGGV